MHFSKASILVLGAACWPAPAFAQAELFGPEAIEASADLRASVAGGEDSWLDGGFGKLRYGGDGGDTEPAFASPRSTWPGNRGSRGTSAVSSA